MTRGRSPAVLACLLAAAILSACTGGEGGSDVPEDFVTVEGDGYAFAYPPEWSPDPEQVSGEGLVVETVGLEPGDGGIITSAALALDPSASGSFEVIVQGLTTAADIRAPGGREITDEDPSFEVPGATDAHLIDSTRTEPHPETGEEVQMRQFDLLAMREDGVLAYLFVSAPEDDFDEDTARAIVESLDLR